MLRPYSKMKTQIKILWLIADSGRLSGLENMSIDEQNLAVMNEGTDARLKLRFFQWDKPTVSFGYNTNQGKVQRWATEQKAKYARYL